MTSIFIIDGKKLDIQNFDMSEQVKKGTASELKRSLVNQCTNRLVLELF